MGHPESSDEPTERTVLSYRARARPCSSQRRDQVSGYVLLGQKVLQWEMPALPISAS